MTRFARGFAVAVLLAGMAMGWASPASAQPPPPNIQIMQGNYQYVEEGMPTASWSVRPTCVPLYCTLHVTSSTPEQVTFEERFSNFGGVANQTGGLWNLYLPMPNGIQCPDGTVAATEDTWWFNPILLTGTHTKMWKRTCGLEPDMVKKPFTLTFTGPLPAPVDQYPLYCTTLQYCIS